MGQINSTTLGISLSVSLFASALYLACTYVFRRTKLSIVPGPKSRNIILGHMPDVWGPERSPKPERWVEEYGPVMRFHGLLNDPELLTTDIRAIQHVLYYTDIYQKPSTVQRGLAQVLGWGVLVTEGEKHRIQRKALNPAFGPGQLRDLTGIFLDKANELRDVLSSCLSGVPSESMDIEALSYLSRCTLDIIGLAGFGYSFDSLSSSEANQNELWAAFKTMFRSLQSAPVFNALAMMIPSLRHLPISRNKKVNAAMAVVRRVGTQLLNERKALANAEAAMGEKITDSRARDILSLLVRANISANPRERLSDEEVLAQIPTFLVAGHETTATLLSWILFRLCLHTDVQSALRAECRENPLPTSAHGNEPLDQTDLSALDKLPLLDAVVRETLRLDAPVSDIARSALKDDVLPLSKPFVDVKGQLHDSLFISKGDTITMSLAIVNHSKEMWGPDAKDWNPRRWTDGAVPEAVKGIPGIWGNVLSFSGGTHACIGYRFSLLEAKIILHALISSLEFKLAVPREEIGEKSGIVTRPFIKSRVQEGAQLPLKISKASVAVVDMLG